LYIPAVVFIKLNGEAEFFYSQEHYQVRLPVEDSHFRRTDCITPLREDALCNPPFLERVAI
jgi:hypothetical protein